MIGLKKGPSKKYGYDTVCNFAFSLVYPWGLAMGLWSKLRAGRPYQLKFECRPGFGPGKLRYFFFFGGGGALPGKTLGKKHPVVGP